MSAAGPLSMIANRLETKPATPGRLLSPNLQGRNRTTRINQHVLSCLIVAVAALSGMCVPGTAFGRQQSASASTQAEQQLAQVNASRAAKDVEVGTFYMHKGDYGAAISRFEEAVQLDPKNPKARLRLAESYAKQGDGTNAIKTYKAYLREFPNARDEKNIRKKIEELSRKED
jgi:tetratricopeptide (TPR) repeat protein